MPPTFRMPAEWEPHAATWLAWPHNLDDWPGKFAIIPHVYAEIVRTLSRFEPVHLLVSSADHQAAASELLESVRADTTNVTFHVCPTDRSWLRDSGPIFVKQGDAVVGQHWRFNAWAKYDNHTLDQHVGGFIARAAGAAVRHPLHGDWRVVLEGGSIDVNGTGRLLTTEECLLSQTQERNPPMNRADYETVFARELGVTEVIWLKDGIVGDDTHGHVDDLARFVNASTVLTVVEPNPADDNHARLNENLDRLRAVRDLEVVTLPMPRPVWHDGVRLPASYANFYIANGVVILPTFNDPADRVALGTLADVFPNRQVVGIHCTDLVWGLGTLHCMTQQQPV